jgi:hypothetical protein
MYVYIKRSANFWSGVRVVKWLPLQPASFFLFIVTNKFYVRLYGINLKP